MTPNKIYIPAEWSEEDEKIRKSLVEFFGKFKPQDMWNEMLSFGDVLSYLEKQKPAEWSEEDEKMLQSIIEDYEAFDKELILTPIYHHKANWLKSLRPQPHWKPNEEQMEVLNEVIGDERMEDTAACDKKAETLESLYNDLKKL